MSGAGSGEYSVFFLNVTLIHKITSTPVFLTGVVREGKIETIRRCWLKSALYAPNGQHNAEPAAAFYNYEDGFFYCFSFFLSFVSSVLAVNQCFLSFFHSFYTSIYIFRLKDKWYKIFWLYRLTLEANHQLISHRISSVHCCRLHTLPVCFLIIAATIDNIPKVTFSYFF